MSPSRVWTLIGKELLELARMRWAAAAMIVLAVVLLALPFGVVTLPAITGGSLAADRAVQEGVRAVARHVPAFASLTLNGAAQALIFRQFLPLLILLPIGGATTIAGYSIVGEKQTRSLEPLLATPITTGELLLAKILSGAIPPLVVMFISVGVFVAGVAWIAEPGVLEAVLTPSTFVTVFVFGPIATLAALTLTATISSRVNDPRSAQQIGVMVVLPVVGLLVAQFSGALFLGGRLLVAVVLAGAALDAALFGIAVGVFTRETILTRWK